MFLCSNVAIRCLVCSNDLVYCTRHCIRLSSIQQAHKHTHTVWDYCWSTWSLPLTRSIPGCSNVISTFHTAHCCWLYGCLIRSFLSSTKRIHCYDGAMILLHTGTGNDTGNELFSTRNAPCFLPTWSELDQPFPGRELIRWNLSAILNLRKTCKGMRVHCMATLSIWIYKCLRQISEIFL